jgi:hypothetical protein
MGQELLAAIEQLSNGFAWYLRLRAAIIQEQDDVTGTDTAFVTPAKQFGFVDAAGALSSAVAHAAFTELDAFNTTCASALTQLCARLKQ